VAGTPPAWRVAPAAGFRSGSTEYLPLRAVTDCFGLVLFKEGPGALAVQRPSASGPELLARVRLGRRLSEVPALGDPAESGEPADRQWLCLPAAPRLEQGRVYVPSEFIEALLGVRYSTVVEPNAGGDWRLVLPDGGVLSVPMRAK